MRRALFPASFNPIHRGHCDIAERASHLFDEVVLGVFSNPAKSFVFPQEQRVDLARQALAHVENITVQPYGGLTVDFAKEIGAIVIVRGLRVFSDFELEFRMALANNRLAPDIEIVCLMAREQHMHLASSTIVEIASLGGDISSMVPKPVEEALLAYFDKMGHDEP
ncbi:MAG: pantetheine-phosphate adenylyltransferase [Chloroflexi bacterium]|nr:pantetheine-phosphate adenylyltransferase [Chloroflexota bacterium]